MALRHLFRKSPQPSPPPDPVKEWVVQFEKGGREYTYRWTEANFRAFLIERRAYGRELPYTVKALRNGQVIDVQVRP